MNDRHPLVLSALLVFLTLYPGCGKSEVSNDMGDPPLANASLDSGTESDLAEKQSDPSKTEWNRETAAEADIPNDIPVYTNAIPLDGSATDRLFVFHWETKDPKSDVMDFYRKQLPDAGWNILSEEAFGSFKASQGDRELDVWIGSEPNKPVSILVRLSR
tara:strand:+ start:95835 stop:96314 length:480 start_codon:yes stop_codon:yes gene_type:complete